MVLALGIGIPVLAVAFFVVIIMMILVVIDAYDDAPDWYRNPNKTFLFAMTYHLAYKFFVWSDHRKGWGDKLREQEQAKTSKPKGLDI